MVDNSVDVESFNHASSPWVVTERDEDGYPIRCECEDSNMVAEVVENGPSFEPVIHDGNGNVLCHFGVYGARTRAATELVRNLKVSRN